MKDKAKKNRSNIVDKMCARVCFDEYTGWRTDFPQVFDNVIDKARRACGMIRGASVCVRNFIAIESAAKLGLYAGINQKSDFKVTWPDWMSKRWRAVGKRAYRAGYEYGTVKADVYVATPVPIAARA